MIKTLLLLTGFALVQARSNGDAVVNNARLFEPLQTSALSNPDDCETLANGCPTDFTIHKLIPHEKYCHLFYNCDKGELVLQSCSKPLYFDPRLGCVWPEDTDCVNDGPYTYPPTAAPENDTTPGDIGDVLDNGCPADFDVQHLLPHEECEKYYQCYNGQKIERDCQPGTVFNFPAQFCDWPFNVPNCAGSPGATARPTAAPDSNDPDNDWEALPNGCPADFKIEHLLPHESDCYKYYACVGGGLVEMGCPPRLHFSPSQKICTWPHEAGCEHWECAPGDNDNCCTDADSISTTPATTTTAGPADSISTTLATTTMAGPADSISTTPATTTTAGPADSSEEILNPSDPELPEEWESLPNGCPADFDIDYLLPHEYDCEKFYYCVHGNKVEFSCAPNGTHFSPALQRCTWPEEAGCESSNSTGTVPDRTTTPAPGNTPPSTTNSVPDITTTNRPGDSSEDTPKPSDPELPGEWESLPNGCPADFDIDYLLPHEYDCEKFYYCVHGNKVEFSCAPNGTHFSPALQRCTWPEEAGCETSNSTGTVPDSTTTSAPGNTPPSTTSSVPDITTTARPADSNEDLPGEWEALPNGCPADFDILHLLPHEYDCEKFYYCAYGEKIEFSCAPNGTHFSPTQQRCLWPEEAGCEHWDPTGTVPDTTTTLVPENTPPSTTSSVADITTPGSTTTTVDPDCPDCPVDPADICKESCNVAPWPHPECDKFYFCIGDQARLGICAEGLHFNPRTFSCDFICNAGCVRNIPQITRHADGLLMFVPNAWGKTDEVMDRIERELNAEL